MKASSCIIPKASLSSEVSSSVISFQRCTRPRNWESSEQQQQQHVGQYTDDVTPCKRRLLFQPDGSRARNVRDALIKEFQLDRSKYVNPSSDEDSSEDVVSEDEQ